MWPARSAGHAGQTRIADPPLREEPVEERPTDLLKLRPVRELVQRLRCRHLA